MVEAILDPSMQQMTAGRLWSCGASNGLVYPRPDLTDPVRPVRSLPLTSPPVSARWADRGTTQNGMNCITETAYPPQTITHPPSALITVTGVVSALIPPVGSTGPGLSPQ